ncbi:MAG: hypothetical protein ACREOJ_15925 [Gemmatimonadaceae bacterium]
MHAPWVQFCRLAAAGVALAACADSGAVAGPAATRRTTVERSIEPAALTIFDVPGASRTFALDINAEGEIVGRYLTAGQNHGFLRDLNGTLTTIDYPGSNFSVASSINDSGAIVGWYSLPADPIRHGFLLRDGVFTSFDPPGSTFTNPLGINNRGEVTGRFCTLSRCLPPGLGSFHGFLFQNGVFTIIDVPGGNETNAFKPNENGAIVGGFGEGGTEQLFVLTNGQFATMGLPNGNPATQDDGGMNARGDIVGTYCQGAPPCLVGPSDNHGFLLSGGQLTTIDVAGATATALTAINARGDMVGGYIDASGLAHSFLLHDHGGGQ